MADEKDNTPRREFERYGDESDTTEKGLTEQNNALACPSSTSERALIRKLDFRLMPVVILLYLFAFLDRINISNAITLGLQEQLHLKGNDVNVALAIFYVPYIIFEIPSNYLLKRLHPHIWLSGAMVLFGIITLTQGFVTSYGGLLAARFFLGLVECTVFPGCSYLMTVWYKPSEVLQRFAIFFNAITLAGSFGGLLASGIANMDGLRGYSGWQWIFVIEGIMSALVGFLCFFWIPDFLHSARWLSAEEKEFMRQRLLRQDEKTETTFAKELKTYFSDWRSYNAGFLYVGSNIVAYSGAYFLPTIVKGFHYNSIQTQLHSVPPFAAAFCWSIGLAFLSVRLSPPLRLSVALFSFCLVFVGLGILLNVHTNIKAQYAAVFFVIAGGFGGVPIILVTYFTSLEPNWQRAIGTAFMIGFGSLGGIVATFSFETGDAPEYHKGYSIVTFGMSLAAVGTVVMIVDELRKGRRRSNV